MNNLTNEMENSDEPQRRVNSLLYTTQKPTQELLNSPICCLPLNNYYFPHITLYPPPTLLILPPTSFTLSSMLMMTKSNKLVWSHCFYGLCPLLFHQRMPFAYGLDQNLPVQQHNTEKHLPFRHSDSLC